MPITTPRRLTWFPSALAALATSIGLLASASSAQGAYQWSDGLIEKSTITNCPSVIQGFPYQEEGAWTWAGQYLDTANPPDVNSTFYVHVVAGAVGNACSGQRVHFELLGPAGGGMSTQITPSTPVYCYAINYNTSPTTVSNEPAYPNGACPTGPQSGGFYGNFVFDAQGASGPYTWPLPQGWAWEIQIPVSLNREASGGSGTCNNCNTFLSRLLDGNSSPQLFPRQGLFVNGFAGGGGSTPGGSGGGSVGLPAAPQQPAQPASTTPPAPAPTPAALTQQKCKKGQTLRKGKCVKKKGKKK